MARMPGAIWEPVTGHTNGPMEQYLGIVLHCNDAESLDLHDFFQASTGDSAVSSHFQVLKDGTIYQYIDTADSAWCQAAGNGTYLSIESQGLADEPATAQQIVSIGRILAFVNIAHGIPLIEANSPGEHGFGWHGMGAPAWGHAVCPGVRRDQRPAMLAAAAPTPAPAPPASPEEADMEFGLPHIVYDKTAPQNACLIYPFGLVLPILDGNTVAGYTGANVGVPMVPVGDKDFARILNYVGEPK